MIILDLILLSLIIVCISYCWILNGKIRDLNNSRVEFARMIKELNVSIVQAQESVATLSELSKITATDLQNSIDQATDLVAEIKVLKDVGENLLDKIDSAIKIGRNELNAMQQTKKGVKKIPKKPQNLTNGYFSEEDLVEDSDNFASYEAHLKTPEHKNTLRNVLTKIVTGKKDQNMKLDQRNYYDTLRKISGK